MLAIGQNAPELHLYIGKAWLAKGHTHKAVKEFNAAAAARPNLPLVQRPCFIKIYHGWSPNRSSPTACVPVASARRPRVAEDRLQQR